MSNDFDVVTGPAAPPPKPERAKPPAAPSRRGDGTDAMAAVPRERTGGK
jgi:hypothetical protein